MIKIYFLRYLYPAIAFLGTYVHTLHIVRNCNSSIYCRGELLHTTQLSKVFKDSRTFVELHLLTSEAEALENFNILMRETNKSPTRKQIMKFLDDHFEDKIELHSWYPSDFNSNPPVLNEIKNLELQQFAKEIIGIWPKISRKVTPDVAANPNRYSFIYLPKGFIVPGGRSKELHYWDSYWIIKGLLISDMIKTARGMIENFLHLVNKFGYVPSGSRIYYLGRSEPPFLAWMVYDYFAKTGDVLWLNKHIEIVEKELRYWLEKKMLVVKMNDHKYELLRYVPDHSIVGPRPEAYYEDYMYGKTVPLPLRNKFYMEVRSAAESGWDLSSRWFVKSGSNFNFNMTFIKASHILPVDLNSIFAGALQKMGDLKNEVEGYDAAKLWWDLARKWRYAIENVMWDSEDGVWYDYDSEAQVRLRNFFLSCAAPLWADAVHPWLAFDHTRHFVQYLRSTGALEFPGGVPTSLRYTGEKWDYPNVWPPLQAMLIGALEKSDCIEAKKLARKLIKTWIRVAYMGFNKHRNMFEKYSCSNPGEHGGGGTYDIQTGYGWTNGYILELLHKYGNELNLK